jgi:hypothetical protein
MPSLGAGEHLDRSIGIPQDQNEDALRMWTFLDGFDYPKTSRFPIWVAIALPNGRRHPQKALWGCQKESTRVS